MRSITKMTRMRDLSSEIPDKLNPFLKGSGILEYSRLFIHAHDGFGFYPRFKSWPSVTERINSFRNAIREIESDWSDFLSWRGESCGNSELGSHLNRGMHEMEDNILYDALLTVTLNTPASWGDFIVWEAFKAMPVVQPCVANWNKVRDTDPWSVEIQCLNTEGLTTVKSGSVTQGMLPERVNHLAFIFWDYLYPLVQREQYAPPQNPTKYISGKVVQLTIPLLGGSSTVPFGWISSHIGEGDAAAILHSMKAEDAANLVNELARVLEASISCE